MISRFNYKPIKKRDSSKDDDIIRFVSEKRIRVLSTNKDGSVDKYVEEEYFKEEKSKWSDFIMSYNLGSVQEQVMNHITKGTPLVTAHTLPSADYTKLEKGAKIKREMSEKGITLDMLVKLYEEAQKKDEQSVQKEEN